MGRLVIRKIGDLKINKTKVAVCSLFVILLPILTTSCISAPWDIPDKLSHFNFIWFPFFLISLGIYFLPTIIGVLRHVKNLIGIVLVNIFLGWTFLGWILTLVWSLVGSKGKV
jgi:hypothetical protein